MAIVLFTSLKRFKYQKYTLGVFNYLGLIPQN
jgi:hypothetical protein